MMPPTFTIPNYGPVQDRDLVRHSALTCQHSSHPTNTRTSALAMYTTSRCARVREQVHYYATSGDIWELSPSSPLQAHRRRKHFLVVGDGSCESERNAVGSECMRRGGGTLEPRMNTSSIQR
ncbi:hypothetical protein J6590_008365 [Homalodisca vitripennis]|nr:hypothetical protein J6590_008365 [Homalodisca vitripennis]